MSYSITQDFISKNRSGESLSPVGIVVHETADPGATDENEQSYFDNNYVGASAHAFLDWDSITQTIPWNEKAWHATEPANSMFLGIELCRPYTHDVYAFNEVWNRGVWLFAYLFVNVIGVTTITKDNLMSHDEVREKWHNTTHTDPVAYFAEYGLTVDDFRNDVQLEINSMIGDDTMDTIVTYFGDADAFSAIIVAQKYKCPLMSKSDYDASSIRANNEIIIGGKPGSDRFSTFKDAAELV